MALALYRRHRRDCKSGHQEELRTSEYDERKKGWKRCECPIFASGTLRGTFKRHNTGQWEWAAARAIAADFDAAGNWIKAFPETAPRADAAPAEELKPARITIADAIKVFLSNREGAKIAPATLRKYRTFTKQLAIFTDTRGYAMLDQLTSADIDVFYSGWKLGARAKGKRLGTLRAFFRFCVNRKWIQENPVGPDLKPPVGANCVANKAPFTDEELQRIIDACDRVGEVAWTSGTGQGVWTGEDVKDFIWVMVYTGFRISDVGLFHMKRLNGNEVFLRAKKNGGDVFAYIPDWLRDRLNARARRCGVRPFIVGQSDRLETVTDMWRRKIGKVFGLAGEFDEPPTPHRFRHTFARILLQRGVPVSDVADLLGDDEDTVREHYARWVPERQARLTKILKEAFDDKPKPKLVALPGGRNNG
ncbi:MAG TPA: tyrosine-type recombinase/integrase [Bryobacteraceae bacterium]|nr:tyrosine-type recombinase/integrase [Bryobacteraceae bacterium]HUA83680.1 tyrosine-type recombinase/integrase [Bryobacteraceae bacterium]